MRALATAISFWVLAAAAWLGGGPAARADVAETKVALIIGNSKYITAGELVNPAKDALILSASLKQIGFKVTLKNDITKQDFDRALKDFSRDAKDADIALFYFAGHGVQYGGQNYFLPVDTELKDAGDIEFGAESMTNVVSATNRARKYKIIILDACRNTVADRGGSGSRSVAELGISAGLASGTGISNADGMIVFYSAEPGKEAEDGVGAANSPFASSLAKRIVEPNVKIQDVFQTVSNDVYEGTRHAQQPEIAKVEIRTNVILNPAETDQERWQRIKDSSDPQALADFLTAFPRSVFSDVVREKIGKLKGDPDEDWRKIKASNGFNDPKVLQEFIRKFPDSTAADAAQGRLDKLDAERRDQDEKKREQELAAQIAAQQAEAKRKADAAEQERIAKEKEDSERKAAAEKAALDQRIREEATRAAEAERQRRIAEDQRKADEAKAEADRKAKEQAEHDAEAKRLADQAAADRKKAEDEADAQRKAEASLKAAESERLAAEARDASKREEAERLQAEQEAADRKRLADEAARRAIADACARDMGGLAALKQAKQIDAIKRLREQSICPTLPASADQAVKDIAALQAGLCAADRTRFAALDSKNLAALQASLATFQCEQVRDQAAARVAELTQERDRNERTCGEERVKFVAIDRARPDARARLADLSKATPCADLRPEIDAAVADVDRLVGASQDELQRLGCYLPKTRSERFDDETIKALAAYFKARGQPDDLSHVHLTAGLLEELHDQDFKVCQPAQPEKPVAAAPSHPAPQVAQKKKRELADRKEAPALPKAAAAAPAAPAAPAPKIATPIYNSDF